MLSYRAAMREAERLLATLPISQRVVREAQKVLVAGSGRRASVLAFPALLNIAEGREVL